MSEEHYQTLGRPMLEPIDADFRLRTASGALMPGMGCLTCEPQIGDRGYVQDFIVCKHLVPGLILGWDFFPGINWGSHGDQGESYS